MIIPSFLKKKDTIGICAPSAGVGRKLESFDRSLHQLKKEGYQIRETPHVRVNNLRGGTPNQRAKEFNDLVQDSSIDFIMAAAGGEYLMEMLPGVDEEALRAHPKWVMGASDPTSLLLSITTKLDIATLYGFNAGSYDLDAKDQSLQNNLAFLKGDWVTQKSFSLTQSFDNFFEEQVTYTEKNLWEGKDLTAQGRCIGGCLDVIKDLMGTPYLDMNGFLNRYETDGIIWYLDIFDMSAAVVYRTLLQMKAMGWFKTTKAVMIGKVLFKNEDLMTYHQAAQKALGRIPFVSSMDIGHLSPKMTLVNGALLKLKVKQGKGSLQFIKE